MQIEDNLSLFDLDLILVMERCLYWQQLSALWTEICPSSMFSIQTLHRRRQEFGHKHPVQPKEVG